MKIDNKEGYRIILPKKDIKPAHKVSEAFALSTMQDRDHEVYSLMEDASGNFVPLSEVYAQLGDDNVDGRRAYIVTGDVANQLMEGLGVNRHVIRESNGPQR